MKVLVTGATGFLGGRVTRALLSEGHEVRATGRRGDVLAELAAAGADTAECDLRNPAAVLKSAQGVDAVYHSGAIVSPWGRWQDFYDVNVTGTANVISACHEQRVKRLIHISSPSVVFNGRDQPNLPETETYPKRFLSPYPATKKLAEELVCAASGSLETVILRPRAVFGPGDTSIFPRLLDASRHGRLRQIGHGDNQLDITYIDNAVDAMISALTASAPVGGIYSITNGEPIRIWDAIRTILSDLSLQSDLRRVPFSVAFAAAGIMEAAARVTGREPRFTRFSVAVLARTQTFDISAARRDLGYAPRVPLDEGLRRTIAALKLA